MIEWLKKVRAPKFYRYFFYRGYVLSKSCSDTEPAFSSMVGMSIALFFQFFFVLFGFAALLNIDLFGSYLLNIHPLRIILFALLFISANYFLFYYKGKWSKIIQEFEGESEKQRLLGKYYLFIYLFICIVVLFRTTLWFIETTSPYVSK